jgi:hypothetical protein
MNLVEKYVLISLKTAVRKHNLEIANRSFENEAKVRYLGCC